MKKFKNNLALIRNMKDWQRVEAVLFGSGKYLTEEQISTISGVPKKNIKKVLSDLKKHYEQIESSLAVFNEVDSWKLNVKEEYTGIVKNVISEAEMPKAIMETLALIAYTSPVMQAEIIDRRGSGAYDHIGVLEDKGFITKEKFGRTFKIRISQKFYDYFDIDGDKKLRQMFKNVKKPETLGTLEVYTEENKGTYQEQEFNDKVLERMKKVEENPLDHEEKKKFLEEFDKKFDKAKTNIDEADKEMNEFRKIPPADSHKEGQAQSTIDDETNKILKKFNEEIDELEGSDKEIEEEQELVEEQDEEKKQESNEPKISTVLVKKQSRATKKP